MQSYVVLFWVELRDGGMSNSWIGENVRDMIRMAATENYFLSYIG